MWCQDGPDDAHMLNQLLIDVHSPSKYRVFGTIQNFPGFQVRQLGVGNITKRRLLQKAFNCPAGSAYAPDKHCNVWTSKATNGKRSIPWIAGNP